MKQEEANQIVKSVFLKEAPKSEFLKEAMFSCDPNLKIEESNFFKIPISYLLELGRIYEYNQFMEGNKNAQFTPEDVYQLLKKSNLNQLDKSNGQTPMMFLCKFKKRIIDLNSQQIFDLIEQSDVNIQDSSGRTVFSYLIGNNQFQDLNLSEEQITKLLNKYKWNTKDNHDEKIVISLWQYAISENFLKESSIQKIVKKYKPINNNNLFDEILQKKRNYNIDEVEATYFFVKKCKFKISEEDKIFLEQQKAWAILDCIKKIEIEDQYKKLNKKLETKENIKNNMKI